MVMFGMNNFTRTSVIERFRKCTRTLAGAIQNVNSVCRIEGYACIRRGSKGAWRITEKTLKVCNTTD